MQFQTVLCLYVPDLVYCGRILHDDVSLASCGLASGSIVLALKKTPSLKPSSEHGISQLPSVLHCASEFLICFVNLVMFSVLTFAVNQREHCFKYTTQYSFINCAYVTLRNCDCYAKDVACHTRYISMVQQNRCCTIVHVYFS